MGSREEILDSDDDGSGDGFISPSKLGVFGDTFNTPAAPDQTGGAALLAHAATDGAHENGESRNITTQQEDAHPLDTSSSSAKHCSSEVTDPDFWRGYNKRLAAVQTPGGESTESAAHALTGGSLGGSGGGDEGAETIHQSKQKRQTTAGKKDHSSPPTSLTDPRNNMTRDRRRKAEKAAGDSSSAEVIDLTLSQGTAPASGDVDPWAVPSSPAAFAFAASPRRGETTEGLSLSLSQAQAQAQARAKKTPKLGKRKGGGEHAETTSPLAADSAGLGVTHDDMDGASPMPAPKRIKRATQSSLATVDETQPLSSDRFETVDASEDRPTGSSGRAARRSTKTSSSDIIIRDSNTGNGTGSSQVIGGPGPHASTSLYIAPSALTDSQKLQYYPVSLSPEDELLRGTRSAVIASTLAQTVLLEQTAGSSAPTIPYPTPSRFAASPKARSPDELALASTPAAVEGLRDPMDPSSPDIISAPSASAARQKRAATVLQESELPLPEVVSPLRLVRDTPKSSTRHAHEDTPDQQQEELKTGAFDDLAEAPAPSPIMDVVGKAEPAPKKKRGRKKKEVPILNDLAPLQLEAESTAAEEIAGEEPAKKKRGRPRKPDPPKTAPHVEELSPAPVTEGCDVDDTQPSNQGEDAKVERNANEAAPPAPPEKKPGKRGRKRKQPGSGTPVEKEKEEADAGARAEKAALGEISSNSQRGTASIRPSQSPGSKTGRADKGSLREDSPSDAREENSDGRRATAKGALAVPAKEADKEVSPATPEPAATTTKTPRTGSAAGSAAGNVRYRVGLSRKSHIAPLLKSLKK